VPLSANGTLGVTGFNADTKYHFYLDGTETDVPVTAHSRGYLLQVGSTASVCLHLNGHNMVTPGNIYLSSGAKLNIMGTGSVTYTGTASSSTGLNVAFIYADRSTVTLYGGTYNLAETAMTANYPIYYTKSNRQNLTVCGKAVINGIVDCGLYTYRLTVDGNSFIRELIVNDSTDAHNSATFTVAPTFQGTIAKLSAQYAEG